MKGKSFVLAVLIFILCTVFCFSLELNNGRIKLVLHKNIGRFSLYYLSDQEEQRYTSFFLDQDVRTSVISIVIDNKIYRLGESGYFKETIEETSNGARFFWESRQLEITEDFAFLSSSGSGETDGVMITLSLKNILEKPLKVGVRYLFDTYLGESHNHHFKTNIQDNVTNETVIEKKNMISYWVSQDSNTEDVGLQVVTGSSQISKPDKIILANWKRLNETSWTYLSSGSRDFSARPYSINDSAVCHYYNPTSLAGGKTKKIMLMIMNVSKNAQDAITDSTFAAFEAFDEVPGEDIQSDILVLENLLLMINTKINSGEIITDKDIIIMEKIIEEIKIRLEAYE